MEEPDLLDRLEELSLDCGLPSEDQHIPQWHPGDPEDLFGDQDSIADVVEDQLGVAGDDLDLDRLEELGGGAARVAAPPGRSYRLGLVSRGGVGT